VTDLVGDLLRRVSRSFYLSLAILPRALREPLGLAYLLARASDTVADTRLLPRAERLRHLATLGTAYAGAAAPEVAGVARACAGETLARVERLPAGDRTAVRAVLATITEGQRFDLERFPGEDAAGLAALDTLADLDRYTYLVAGCVGEFWTRLCVAHRPRLAAWDVAAMTATGVRFGKALQLTNVLRDVPADLHQGRCYLPARELAALGLGPRDLLDTQRTPAARPLLDRLLRLALEHYDAAWRYTLAIPRAEWRLRLACAWPLLIGLGTLAAIARHPNPLAVARPIKISRGAVRAILARSALAVWSDAALRREAGRLRAAVRV